MSGCLISPSCLVSSFRIRPMENFLKLYRCVFFFFFLVAYFGNACGVKAWAQAETASAPATLVLKPIEIQYTTLDGFQYSFDYLTLTNDRQFETLVSALKRSRGDPPVEKIRGLGPGRQDIRDCRVFRLSNRDRGVVDDAFQSTNAFLDHGHRGGHFIRHRPVVHVGVPNRQV